MMKLIGAYIPSDEDAIDFKYFQAAQLFEFYRNLVMEGKDSIEVVYSEKKDTNRIYLPLGMPPVKTVIKRVQDSYAIQKKMLNDIGKFSILKNKYGYFRFISFKNCLGKRYDQFLEKSFKEIKKKKIKKIVFDLRGNNGGQMQFSLLRYLVGPDVYIGKYQVNKPFKLFRNKYISKMNFEFKNHKKLSRRYKKMEAKDPRYDGSIRTGTIDESLVFKGNILVITDEGTFSAASILACHLKTLAHARIVGQRAGGSFYCGNAGTLSVKLPYSKCILYVNPNTFWSQLPYPEKDPLKIKDPDLVLEPISPKSGKKDDWYINKALKGF